MSYCMQSGLIQSGSASDVTYSSFAVEKVRKVDLADSIFLAIILTVAAAATLYGTIKASRSYATLNANRGILPRLEGFEKRELAMILLHRVPTVAAAVALFVTGSVAFNIVRKETPQKLDKFIPGLTQKNKPTFLVYHMIFAGIVVGITVGFIFASKKVGRKLPPIHREWHAVLNKVVTFTGLALLLMGGAICFSGLAIKKAMLLYKQEKAALRQE